MVEERGLVDRAIRGDLLPPGALSEVLVRERRGVDGGLLRGGRLDGVADNGERLG
jgi:hypothetical protein